ncbi:Plp2p [Saccharomyces cerevisiae x Saccharomyces kudriavzevii VIN7]|uniref:Plp2p n=1 Tax=Saccharomyces cerevisiae x Saccharomyces kudriavzevii (strain VIN7) TaxID=1095631 RepID=H0H1G9_SACCK|nr:Plp2p [Saccharomyces cerevisiae x Saccharomyces kudriavzevii VIN7]
MQNEPMFQVQVDESEDSEWNDILRAKGVIPERAPSPTGQLEEALEEALAKQHENRLEDKGLSDLEELEDDEDDDFLEAYKMKRLNEIRKLQERSKFGDVYFINKPEYNKEVTLASQGKTHESSPTDENGKKDEGGVYVFVHLSLQSKLQSRILSHLFQSAASKFKEIKFVEIPANRAIENYPESNCPTLIVYYRGEVIKNMITLLELGGNNSKMKDFESFMVKVGAVTERDSRLIMNQDDAESREERQLHFAKKNSIRSGIGGKFDVGIGNDDDNINDDDDGFFD